VKILGFNDVIFDCTDEIDRNSTSRGGYRLPGDITSIPATHFEVIFVYLCTYRDVLIVMAYIGYNTFNLDSVSGS